MSIASFIEPHVCPHPIDIIEPLEAKSPSLVRSQASLLGNFLRAIIPAPPPGKKLPNLRLGYSRFLIAVQAYAPDLCNDHMSNIAHELGVSRQYLSEEAKIFKKQLEEGLGERYDGPLDGVDLWELRMPAHTVKR